MADGRCPQLSRGTGLLAALADDPDLSELLEEELEQRLFDDWIDGDDTCSCRSRKECKCR